MELAAAEQLHTAYPFPFVMLSSRSIFSGRNDLFWRDKMLGKLGMTDGEEL